ncbi:hypothetical protein [Streptomyces sp. NPDC048172]|uniref:hypothetical protein n=1 Tax=Streptomyces sp. NPDC048172 TaxID=3365505 RepID=UPI003712A28B
MSDGGDYGNERHPASRGGRLTTRTRLPDGEGGRTPTPRPGRSLITVVGVVVLLIAAIAFANRGGGGGGSDDGGGGGGDRKPEAAQPTAPTGKKPRASGFAKTEQGAQSAAANYAVALVSADIIKPGERGDIVRQVFVPDKTDSMLDKMDKAYSTKFLDKMGLDKDGNAKNGMTYISRTAPMGTKVVDYSSSSAKLQVWCTGVFGTAGEKSTSPVTSDWFTLNFDLRWIDGDWKVQSFEQKEGPAPVNGDNRASSADEIADAVDKFGGFTYAR